MLFELVRYVGFSPEDAALLRAASPLVEPSFDTLITAFYEAIEANPRASAVFENEAQMARQKCKLRGWLESLFGGTYDEPYFESRARIGRAHVRIELDPSLVVAAMSVVRAELSRIADAIDDREAWPPARIQALKRAMGRICDVDSAIMIESYRDDFASRIRSAERLAALGTIAGTLGHELRNPFAVMQTSVHLLKGRVTGDEVAERQVTRLAGQITLCSNVVGEIMDLAHDLPPKRQWQGLHELLEDALSSVVGGQRVGLTTSPEDGIRCFIDSVQVRQLIVNLVTYVIQASPSGAELVSLSAEVRDEVLLLVVEGDAPGILEDLTALSFEPGVALAVNGFGFALPLCRRIAERHGGHLRAASSPEGGTRLEASLPCAAPAAPEA